MASSRARGSIYLLYGKFLRYNSMIVYLNPKPLPEYCTLILCPAKEFHAVLYPALVVLGGAQIIME